MIEIACPLCGESDDLSGSPENGEIVVTCHACNESWVRDTTPRCKTCGNEDVREAVQAVVEKSRGTQLSMTSLRQIWLCPDCDPEALQAWLLSNRPIPPDELPTT